MKLRDIIDSPCGLRYVIDSLPLASGYSLRYLMDTEALTAQEDIAAAYSRMREHLSAAGDGNPGVHASFHTVQSEGYLPHS